MLISRNYVDYHLNISGVYVKIIINVICIYYYIFFVMLYVLQIMSIGHTIIAFNCYKLFNTSKFP